MTYKTKQMRPIPFFLLAMLGSLGCWAQPGLSPEIKAQVETMRVGTYTNVLNLTAAEAEKFWPIFNEFQAQMEAYRMQLRRERKKIQQNYAIATDAQLQASIDRSFALQQSILDLEKRYTAEFKKAIPLKKIALLPKAERDFHRELLYKFKQARDEDMGME